MLFVGSCFVWIKSTYFLGCSRAVPSKFFSGFKNVFANVVVLASSFTSRHRAWDFLGLFGTKIGKILPIEMLNSVICRHDRCWGECDIPFSLYFRNGPARLVRTSSKQFVIFRHRGIALLLRFREWSFIMHQGAGGVFHGGKTLNSHF